MSYKYNVIQISLHTVCNYIHARVLCYDHNIWQNNVEVLKNVFVNVLKHDN